MKKSICALFIFTIFTLMFSTFCFADGSYTGYFGDAIDNIDNGSIDSDMQNKVQTLTVTVFDVVQYIGMFLAVVMLIIFGITWMTANPTDKARLKDKLWTFLIAIIFILFAPQVAEFIWNIVENVPKS